MNSREILEMRSAKLFAHERLRSFVFQIQRLVLQINKDITPSTLNLASFTQKR